MHVRGTLASAAVVVALAAAGSGYLATHRGNAPVARARHASMGIDAFGHTVLTPDCGFAKPEDVVRARALVAALRVALEPYADPARAEAGGFHRAPGDVPVGELKHFVSDENVARARTRFDPAHPSALLYRRTASGLSLAGAMYTAPFDTPLDELNRRVPLRLAGWHAHRHICVPHAGATPPPALAAGFGFSGSIARADACARAGGVFLTDVYGWMVHVYPFENDPARWF